jgi:putative transposase
MILTYRYRLLPRKRQHAALQAILESQRQLYNAALEERIDAYRKRGITRSYIDQAKALTEWRQSDPEGRALPVNIQRGTLKRLEQAYTGFFNRVKRGAKPGFPRFRGRGWFDSFSFAEMAGLTVDGSRVRFRGMPGSLRFNKTREIPSGASIRTCIFHRDASGWTIAFAVHVPLAPIRRSKRAVGIDLGIKTFATLSDGSTVPSLKAARRAEGRLRRAQRALQRKQKGSKSRIKAKQRLARCHQAVARRRDNHLHQASAALVKNFDLIAIERLSIGGLARSGAAKEVHDAGWAKFIAMLHYKAERAGARIIEVDPNDTSQQCSGCGARVPKALDVRHHECGECGLSIGRDLNAARNMLHRAGAGPGLLNVA